MLVASSLTVVHMVKAGANMTATIAVSTLAPMPLSVLSLAASVVMTRRCDSPPQRLVSELLTARAALFMGTIMLIFLSGMAVYMGWAGANMTATIAISTLAPMTALALRRATFTMSAHMYNPFKVQKEPIRFKLKICTM